MSIGPMVEEMQKREAERQAEENAKKVKAALENAINASPELTKLIAENERMREALQYYASPEAWTTESCESGRGDYGNKARQALGE